MALERVDPELSRSESGRAGRGTFPDWTVVAAIAGAGSLGALARYGLAEALPARSGGFPVATLLTNLLGSLVIGVALAVLLERFPDARFFRPVLVTGFLGGFTTFSTFAVDADSLVRAHAVGTAVAYVLISAVAGPLCAALGLVSSRARFRIETAEEAA